LDFKKPRKMFLRGTGSPVHRQDKQQISSMFSTRLQERLKNADEFVATTTPEKKTQKKGELYSRASTRTGSAYRVHASISEPATSVAALYTMLPEQRIFRFTLVPATKALPTITRVLQHNTIQRSESILQLRQQLCCGQEARA